VRIEVRATGEYPGDGQPKPVAFPDPAVAATDAAELDPSVRAAYLDLERAVRTAGE
jgi:hypothetical protein